MKLGMSLSSPCFTPLKRNSRPRPYHFGPLFDFRGQNRQRYLWGFGSAPAVDSKNQTEANLSIDSQTDGTKLFSEGRGLATRMSADRRFQYTQINFDENGDAFLRHGYIQRSELVSRYGILTRDLRKIDQSQLPAILARQSTILLNLLRFRVLITHKDSLILNVFDSQTKTATDFMEDLRGKLQLVISHHASLPYELRALEAVLIMVVSQLDDQFQDLRKPVLDAIQELEHDVSLDKVKNLTDVSRQLNGFHQKVKLVGDALRTALSADDDMAAMYLSEKAMGKPRATADHEEVELLLENYYECCGELMEKTNNLISDIQVTHDSVKSILDTHRNAIMMLEVHFSVTMLGLAGGTYIAGLYGMNLIHGLEEASFGFPLITGGSIIGIFGLGLFGLHRIRRTTRMLRVHVRDKTHLGQQTRNAK